MSTNPESERPRGMPASGAGAFIDMLAADGAQTQPSVMGDLLRQRFEGDRQIRQTESVWVPGTGPFGDGHWEVIEVIDVGPAPA